MEFFTRGMGDGAAPAQPQARSAARQVVPSNIEAIINSLSAQIRQLHTRMSSLEAAVPKLAANDTKTAQYVNSLQSMVTKVSTKTDQAVAALRQFAAGGGVQPQQFVPRAADAVVAYDTPPRGQPQARSFAPSADEGDVPVDPGGPATEVMDETSTDALFYSGEED